MQNQEKNPVSLEQQLFEAVTPVVNFPVPFNKQRMLLHEMFTSAVANAPDDEIDNYTAKKLGPFYLSLCEFLENIEKIGDVCSSSASA